MTFNYFFPLVLVILSNLIYHITAKNTPNNINSFLSLTVTYVVGAIVSVLMYFIISKPSDVLKDINKLNWTTYILGLVIVGLEIGYIYMYRVGWNISKGSIVASISVAILLVLVGTLFYKEIIGMYQVSGIVFCIIGLILINLH
ncbi:EamA family transporter [Clostridium cylindrosporum]|uniref:EamA domain-containing protein n=1 Tax=Clostridium cylindrosporum DSM 605 TaxID=1121307 RepID=A0A0J8G2G9_CLOCY|nr:EamA family transporter [Clostridium cylindrosporum]KMT21926.1 hypothetical protein CLCY_3c01970 [Clostridium cylindrosporum DSM 605]